MNYLHYDVQFKGHRIVYIMLPAKAWHGEGDSLMEKLSEKYKSDSSSVCYLLDGSNYFDGRGDIVTAYERENGKPTRFGVNWIEDTI